MPTSDPNDDQNRAVVPAGVKASPPDAVVVAVGSEAARKFKMIRFDELAPCGDEIWIENEGELYRLRRTRQGKLILTK